SRRLHTRFSRDWSSDVCSSDLSHFAVALFEHGCHAVFDKELNVGFEYMKVGKGTYQMVELDGVVPYDYVAGDLSPVDHILFEVRSEERRVGRECRSRWRARN